MRGALVQLDVNGFERRNCPIRPAGMTLKPNDAVLSSVHGKSSVLGGGGGERGDESATGLLVSGSLRAQVCAEGTSHVMLCLSTGRVSRRASRAENQVGQTEYTEQRSLALLAGLVPEREGRGGQGDQHRWGTGHPPNGLGLWCSM